MFVNGPASNVDAFCSMIESKTRFFPARDPLGRATYGVIYLWSQWDHWSWSGSQVPQWSPPDILLTTNLMPKRFPEDSLLQLILNTDSAGKMTQCIGPSRLTPPALDAICKAAAPAATPVLDESSKPVSGVQELRIRVTSQAGEDKVMNLVKQLRRLQSPSHP